MALSFMGAPSPEPRSTTPLRTPSPLSETDNDAPVSGSDGAGHLYAGHAHADAKNGKYSSVYQPPSRHRKARSTGWWWWWEIGAVVLSICCIGAILGILKYINDTSVEEWQQNHRISPNSVISILTTISKGAMMVPIASCISQLKWHHFSDQPRRLGNLELFDEASRGPWGALVFLWSLGFRAIVASALAIVTLLALGIDPSAQQLLEISTRQDNLGNATAEMPVAAGYLSTTMSRLGSKYKGSVQFAFQEDNIFDASWNTEVLKRQSAILKGATGTAAEVAFVCPEPATECRWGDFTTLGVCGEAKNVTSEISPVCSQTTASSGAEIVSCRFDFETARNASFVGPSFSPPSDAWYVPPRINMTWRLAPYDGFSYLAAVGSLGYYNGGANLDIVRHNRKDQRESSTMVPMEAWMVQWYWCEQRHSDVVASPTGIKNSKVATEPLYRIEGAFVPTADGDISIPSNYVYQANSTGRNYTIENYNSSDSTLFDYVADAFTNNLVRDQNAGNLMGTAGQNLDKGMQLGGFLHGTDLDRFAKDMANSLTVQVRQTGSVGDNVNGTEGRVMGSRVVRGQATFTVTYYRIRWGWLVLPFAETLATAVLLAYTMSISRQQPLFKSSQVAYLAYGLDAGHRQELHTRGFPESASGLRSTARDIVVEFRENEGGRPAFVRV